MGGGDPDNVTGRGLQALSALNNPELHVKIVIGAANPNREMVEQMADKSSFLVELLTAVSDMTSLYEWADLAISAGGSTCWELCYMGVPFLVVVIAENQLRIAAGLDQAGAALNLGWHDRLETEEVASILGHVIASGEQRAGLRAKGRQLVDGLGAEHVAEILIHAGRG